MKRRVSVGRRLGARSLFLLGSLVLVVGLATACAGEDESPPSSDGQPSSGADTGGENPDESARVSFSEDVEPIITTTCARCHVANGPGTPHLRMDTAGDVAEAADEIATLVEARVMPPWPSSSASVPFVGDWSLSESEISSVVAWAQSGAPLDVEPNTGMAASAGVFGLGDADLVLEPTQGYDGEPSDGDQYRCFVYDPGATEGAWLEGYEFVPDQTEVVHHAIGFLVPASARERAVQLEAEDRDGGWECFGGSRLGINDIFLGWAPGQGPVEMPAGSGLKLEPGDFLVVQIHYHFDVDAPVDSSALHLDLTDAGQELDEISVEAFVAPAEIPCSIGERGPLCDRSAALELAYEKYGGPRGAPANFILEACGATAEDFAHMNEGVASSSCDTRLGQGGEVVSVLGHEHELGKSFRMTLNPDLPGEVVLLDIPKWDFDWQFNYYPVETIDVSPGDVVRIECSWDRSLRDPELEPAYVLWADGTDDEMCFATMSIREVPLTALERR